MRKKTEDLSRKKAFKENVLRKNKNGSEYKKEIKIDKTEEANLF